MILRPTTADGKNLSDSGGTPWPMPRLPLPDRYADGLKPVLTDMGFFIGKSETAEKTHAFCYDLCVPYAFLVSVEAG